MGEYLAEMKELGVYENATIIITADHGDWYSSDELATMVSTPILLVKQAGDTWEELQTSDKQVSHENIIATIVDAVGADSSAYGYTLEEAPQTSTRYFYHITTIEDRVDVIWEFEIIGDANDISNWRYTGNYWLVEFSGVADLYNSADSSQIVNGPSLVRVTCMSAPKEPDCTRLSPRTSCNLVMVYS